jgi:hypothetical protein
MSAKLQRAFLLGLSGGLVLAIAAGTPLMSEPVSPILGLGIALPAGWAGYGFFKKK